jgi:hypothetical protein
MDIFLGVVKRQLHSSQCDPIEAGKDQFTSASRDREEVNVTYIVGVNCRSPAAISEA